MPAAWNPEELDLIQHITRTRLAIGVLIVAALIVMIQLLPAPAGPRAAPRVGIDHFMAGLACVESGGRYDAVNPTSGAYGKYQIMPRNWPVWAGRFLGDDELQPTPRNQELVARARIERLHEDTGSWRRVAYWWLTGGTEADETAWSAKALGYVDRVMTFAHQAAEPGLGGWLPPRCFPADVAAEPATGPRTESAAGS